MLRLLPFRSRLLLAFRSDDDTGRPAASDCASAAAATAAVMPAAVMERGKFGNW